MTKKGGVWEEERHLNTCCNPQKLYKENRHNNTQNFPIKTRSLLRHLLIYKDDVHQMIKMYIQCSKDGRKIFNKLCQHKIFIERLSDIHNIPIRAPRHIIFTAHVYSFTYSHICFGICKFLNMPFNSVELFSMMIESKILTKY